LAKILRYMIAKRIHIIEFKSELRHRFYRELKAAYWRNFEEGLVYASTIVKLDTSVNRAMDKTVDEIGDFIFIEQSLPAY